MDIVFVKIRGYAPWPSQIKEIFEDRLYFVSYFGRRWAEGEWIRRSTISPIGPLENNPVVRKHGRNNEFMEAWNYGLNLLEFIKAAEEEELAGECNIHIPSVATEVNEAPEAVVGDSKAAKIKCAVGLERVPLAAIFDDAPQAHVNEVHNSNLVVIETKAALKSCTVLLKRIPLAVILDSTSQPQVDDHHPKSVVNEPKAANKRRAVLLKRNQSENVISGEDLNAATQTKKRIKRSATVTLDQSPPVKRAKRVLRNNKIIY